ncbi:permease-like cell division protein FtsX [Nocardioides sp.]|uniref:permease-like cell division protein FtsX n=1 Tax=Nocardioides sp. TaxID=35761 RepID=UPI00356B2B17
MQLRYVFTELGQGLRRNLSMHMAVILTLFVSLTLVGMGVLLNQEADRTAEQFGNELQITAYFCKARDDNPACTGEVTDAQKAAITKVMENNPEVRSFEFESQEEALERVKEQQDPELFSGPNPLMTAEDLHESARITLKDPEEYAGIQSALIGLDGVSGIQDLHEELQPIYSSIKWLQRGAFFTAACLVLAALLLVGNTIRLAAFARRREIGIMRLVGASTLYIALPFLLEALVTALLGVLLAAGALGGFMYFVVERHLVTELRFIPWVGLPDYLLALAVIGVVGPLLTLAPTLVLTRKYLKV